MAGGDGRGGCRAASDQRPAPPLRILEADEGLVPRGGGPRPTACMSHTREDNGRARETLPLCTTPRENIPTSVTPANINDLVPREEDVEWAVQKLRGHRLVGTSQIHTEHLWECMQKD